MPTFEDFMRTAFPDNTPEPESSDTSNAPTFEDFMRTAFPTTAPTFNAPISADTGERSSPTAEPQAPQTDFELYLALDRAGKWDDAKKMVAELEAEQEHVRDQTRNALWQEYRMAVKQGRMDDSDALKEQQDEAQATKREEETWQTQKARNLAGSTLDPAKAITAGLKGMPIHNADNQTPYERANAAQAASEYEQAQTKPAAIKELTDQLTGESNADARTRQVRNYLRAQTTEDQPSAAIKTPTTPQPEDKFKSFLTQLGKPFEQYQQKTATETPLDLPIDPRTFQLGADVMNLLGQPALWLERDVQGGSYQDRPTTPEDIAYFRKTFSEYRNLSDAEIYQRIPNAVTNDLIHSLPTDELRQAAIDGLKQIAFSSDEAKQKTVDALRNRGKDFTEDEWALVQRYVDEGRTKINAIAVVAATKYQDPWREMIGQSIFDPLNLVPAKLADTLFAPIAKPLGYALEVAGGTIQKGLNLLPFFARAEKAKAATLFADEARMALAELILSKPPEEDVTARLGRAMLGDIDPTVSELSQAQLKKMFDGIKLADPSMPDDIGDMTNRILKRYNPGARDLYPDGIPDDVIVGSYQRAATNAFRALSGLKPLDTQPGMIGRALDTVHRLLVEEWLSNPFFALAYIATNTPGDFIRSVATEHWMNPLDPNAAQDLIDIATRLGQGVPPTAERTLFGEATQRVTRRQERVTEHENIPIPFIGKPSAFNEALSKLTGINLSQKGLTTRMQGFTRDLFSPTDLGSSRATTLLRNFNLGTLYRKTGDISIGLEQRARMSMVTSNVNKRLPQMRDGIAKVIERMSMIDPLTKRVLIGKLQSGEIENAQQFAQLVAELRRGYPTAHLFTFNPTTAIPEEAASIFRRMADELKRLKNPTTAEITTLFDRARSEAATKLNTSKEAMREYALREEQIAVASAMADTIRRERELPATLRVQRGETRSYLERLTDKLAEMRQHYGTPDGFLRRTEALHPTPDKRVLRQFFLDSVDLQRLGYNEAQISTFTPEQRTTIIREHIQNPQMELIKAADPRPDWQKTLWEWRQEHPNEDWRIHRQAVEAAAQRGEWNPIQRYTYPDIEAYKPTPLNLASVAGQALDPNAARRPDITLSTTAPSHRPVTLDEFMQSKGVNDLSLPEARARATAEFEQLRAANQLPTWVAWQGIDRAEFRRQVSLAAPHIEGERVDAAMQILDRMSQVLQKRTGDPNESIYAHILGVKRSAAGDIEAMMQQGVPIGTSDIWYSQLERTIEAKMPNKASADQIRGILKNTVKPDEIKWTGLDDFLATHPNPTKAEVLEHLRANDVKVEEVMRDTVKNVLTKDEAIARLRENPQQNLWRIDVTRGDPVSLNQVENLPDDMKYIMPGSVPKYSTYTTPGGENYRELLLMLPLEPTTPEIARIQAKIARGETITKLDEENLRNFAMIRVDQGKSFRSYHWDEPNVLAHVRFNDRVDAAGKKTLFIEEIQSDWHQAGREKGYSNPARAVELQAQKNALLKQEDGLLRTLQEKDITQAEYKAQLAELVKQAQPIESELRALQGTVPLAPFAKTWDELALKRMMRYASENDYEQIAWTTGAQQAERYHLANQIDALRTVKNADGTFTFFAVKDGKTILGEEHLTPEQLEQFVGKDLADKIVTDSKSTATYSGLDLQVGGEGMKGFYDTMLVEKANKLGKKWGAKVGETEVQISALPSAEGRRPHTYETVHALPITPEMRASVMAEGFPLFQLIQRPDGSYAPRGAAELTDQTMAWIHLTENSDVSTLLHEAVHVAWEAGIVDPNDLDAIAQFTNVSQPELARWMGGRFETGEREIYDSVREQLAEGFEQYLATEQAPAGLEVVFEKLKAWLADIYQAIRDTIWGERIPEPMRAVYNRMIDPTQVWSPSEQAAALRSAYAEGVGTPADVRDYLNVINRFFNPAGDAKKVWYQPSTGDWKWNGDIAPYRGIPTSRARPDPAWKLVAIHEAGDAGRALIDYMVENQDLPQHLLPANSDWDVLSKLRADLTAGTTTLTQRGGRAPQLIGARPESDWLTANELLDLPETQTRLRQSFDEAEIDAIIKNQHANPARYQPNTYYHTTGPDLGYRGLGVNGAGVGQGLYLGRDRRALDYFYNQAYEYGRNKSGMLTYEGQPKWLDLTPYKNFDAFEELAIKRYGERPHHNHLRMLTLEQGFDGIRYYDPAATGEEFVLYNTQPLKLVRRQRLPDLTDMPSDYRRQYLLQTGTRPATTNLSEWNAATRDQYNNWLLRRLEAKGIALPNTIEWERGVLDEVRGIQQAARANWENLALGEFDTQARPGSRTAAEVMQKILESDRAIYNLTDGRMRLDTNGWQAASTTWATRATRANAPKDVFKEWEKATPDERIRRLILAEMSPIQAQALANQTNATAVPDPYFDRVFHRDAGVPKPPTPKPSRAEVAASNARALDLWERLTTGLPLPEETPRSRALGDARNYANWTDQLNAQIQVLLDQWQEQVITNMSQAHARPDAPTHFISVEAEKMLTQLIANETRRVLTESAEEMNGVLFDYALRGGFDKIMHAISPFYKYQTSIIPWAIKTGLHHPGYVATAQRYRQASDRDLEQRGLPDRFRNTFPLPRASSDPFAQAWNTTLGRAFGQLPTGVDYRMNPLTLLTGLMTLTTTEAYEPYYRAEGTSVYTIKGQLIKEFATTRDAATYTDNRNRGFTDTTPEIIRTLRSAIDTLSALGMRPYPEVQIILFKLGVYGDRYPMDLLPYTTALRAATGVDLEGGLKSWQVSGLENKSLTFYTVVKLAATVQAGTLSKEDAGKAMGDRTHPAWIAAEKAAQQDADTRAMVRKYIPLALRAVDPEEQQLKTTTDGVALLYDALDQAVKDNDTARAKELRAMISDAYRLHPELSVWSARNDPAAGATKIEQNAGYDARATAKEIRDRKLSVLPIGLPSTAPRVRAIYDEYNQTINQIDQGIIPSAPPTPTPKPPALPPTTPIKSMKSITLPPELTQVAKLEPPNPGTHTAEEMRKAWEDELIYRVLQARPDYDRSIYPTYAEYEKALAAWERNLPNIGGAYTRSYGRFEPFQPESWLTSDRLKQWQIEKATPHSAAQSVWFEHYNNKYWNELDRALAPYRDADGTSLPYTSSQRKLAETQVLRNNPTPTPEQMINWIMADYPNRWSREQLLDQLKGVEIMSALERVAAKRTPEQNANTEIADILDQLMTTSQWSTFRQSLGKDSKGEPMEAWLDQFMRGGYRLEALPEKQRAEFTTAMQLAGRKMEQITLADQQRYAEAEQIYERYQQIKKTDSKAAQAYWTANEKLLDERYGDPNSPEGLYWDTYYNRLPPGGKWAKDLFDNDKRFGVLLDPELRPDVQPAFYLKAVQDATQWIMAHPEQLGDPRYYAQARKENEELKALLPANKYEMEQEYFDPRTNRAQYRRDHPELAKAWDTATAYAKEHPVYAYFYQPEDYKAYFGTQLPTLDWKGAADPRVLTGTTAAKSPYVARAGGGGGGGGRSYSGPAASAPLSPAIRLPNDTVILQRAQVDFAGNAPVMNMVNAFLQMAWSERQTFLRSNPAMAQWLTQLYAQYGTSNYPIGSSREKTITVRYLKPQAVVRYPL